MILDQQSLYIVIIATTDIMLNTQKLNKNCFYVFVGSNLDTIFLMIHI